MAGNPRRARIPTFRQAVRRFLSGEQGIAGVGIHRGHHPVFGDRQAGEALRLGIDWKVACGLALTKNLRRRPAPS